MQLYISDMQSMYHIERHDNTSVTQVTCQMQYHAARDDSAKQNSQFHYNAYKISTTTRRTHHHIMVVTVEYDNRINCSHLHVIYGVYLIQRQQNHL